MNYDVILNANDSATLETQYSFTQGDYGQIQFSIRVKADGQYITNAQRAYIVFSLSNGMIVTGADMPKSVATYTYVFKGNELQSPGKVVADVKLVYSNGQISSNKFTFMCRFDPLADKSVPAAPYITVLQQIVDEGQEKINYLQALIDAMQGSIGSTALTRNDLQNTRTPVSAGAKTIDAQMAQYLLLKEDIVNQFLNDSSKPASVALVYSLNQSLAITNSKLQYFECYNTNTLATITPEATMLSGLKEIYSGIPDNRSFSLFASFAGTLVRLDGIKASSQYGKITASSYADAANVTYVISGGTWTKKS